MVDQQCNNTDDQNINDKDDAYPAISEVTIIMREGGDNKAQCYTYQHVSEEQDKGQFCKYMQKIGNGSLLLRMGQRTTTMEKMDAKQ